MMPATAVPASDEVRRRHETLAREIWAHIHRYYVLDDPSVSDAEYDARYRELLALEKAHPDLVHEGSPSQRVETTPKSELAKYERPERMFSLDNAYGEQDLRDFDERVRRGLPTGEEPTYVAEPKLDGASIELIYTIGAGGRATLTLASTRGDGKIGEVVTENVRTVRGLPLTVDVPSAVASKIDRLTLRGEVVIYRRDLTTINTAREAIGEEPFANARNAAAGSLRMLDPRVVAQRPLRLAVYQLVEGPRLFAHHAESLTFLEQLGLPTHRRQVLCKSMDEVIQAIQRFDVDRANYPFETDGAVVKVDAYRQQGVLGETSKFPRWAVAYKFAAERARTQVLSVEVQVGRTGALTPVANLVPVQLAGTTVARASLHNFDQIAALDLHVGDTVEIEKAGEIIPQVMLVIPEERPADAAVPEVPTVCPACRTPVVRVGDEVALRCPNRRCPAVVRAALHYFARRFAMDIDNLGPSLIDQLVGRGQVSDPADLYDLTVDQLVRLERMAKKSATNVVTSIAQSKDRTFDRLLCGLGIPMIGQVAAKQLAERVSSLPEALTLGPDGIAQRASEIAGFGPNMVEALRSYFADEVHLDLLRKLAERSVSRPFVSRAVVVDGPLSGQKFCVTGVLSRKREEVHADIRALGGEIHDSVKTDTTYLVAGDKTGATKLDAARKKGVKVIDEATLNGLIGRA